LRFDRPVREIGLRQGPKLDKRPHHRRFAL
jgi:hypothetical protein